MAELRAITYRRVSTDEQASSGAGLGAQQSAATRAIAARSWQHVGDFADEGISGSVTPAKRPALAEALRVLDAGEADVLVVAKLDRLTRSVKALIDLLDRAENARWSLVILDCDVDTTTAGGRLVASVIGSVAEWERRVIGERTKAALADRKANGVRLGRPVSLPPEVRARIVTERDTGRSLRAIADGLTADGVPTAQGGKWHASTIKSVLASSALDEGPE